MIEHVEIRCRTSRGSTSVPLIEPVEIRSNSSKLPPRATWAEIAPFLRPFWRSAPLGATSERGGAA